MMMMPGGTEGEEDGGGIAPQRRLTDVLASCDSCRGNVGGPVVCDSDILVQGILINTTSNSRSSPVRSPCCFMRCVCPHTFFYEFLKCVTAVLQNFACRFFSPYTNT